MDDGAALHQLLWSGDDQQPVLILPGRGEPAAKYSATAERLSAEGACVRALDWRGQGLSPRHRRAHIARRGHVPSFERLVDDLAQVIDAHPVPPMVIAHSMGGAIMLRLLQKTPQVKIRGAFLVGPMIDIPTGDWAAWKVRLLARLAVWGGQGCRYAPGYSDWSANQEGFSHNRRTSDALAFAQEIALLKGHPELQVGGPTWGWVDGAYRLMRQLWRPWRAGLPQMPVTVAVGEDDTYVTRQRMKAFFARFPAVSLEWIAQGRHELLCENPQVQQQVWALYDHLCRQTAVAVRPSARS